jgi:Zn finger protein HypA/HybF involved in hydrogenase expression
MALSSASCPGSRLIRQPVPEDITCIHCGAEVEIWSFEAITRCPTCGGVVARLQGATCIDWCAAAHECVGEETYNRIMAERKLAREAASPKPGGQS